MDILKSSMRLQLILLSAAERYDNSKILTYKLLPEMLSASILGSLIFTAKSYCSVSQRSLPDGVLQTLEGETGFRRDNLDK